MSRLPGVLGVSLIVALALGGPAYAPIYMKFDGVDGETAAKDHKDWIEIESISFGATSSGRMRGTITTGEDPVAVGMLLPAVQKVRDAANRSSSSTTARKSPLVVYREDAGDKTVKTYWLRDVELSPAKDGQVRITYACKTWRDEATGKKDTDCPPARKGRR